MDNLPEDISYRLKICRGCGETIEWSNYEAEPYCPYCKS